LLLDWAHTKKTASLGQSQRRIYPVHQTTGISPNDSVNYSQSGERHQVVSLLPLNIIVDFGRILDYLPLRTRVHRRGSKPWVIIPDSGWPLPYNVPVRNL